jgi:hypothetical protein
MPPTRFPAGKSIFLPSARNPSISFSHSAALEGYQLPPKAALLSFVAIMVHLLIQYLVAIFVHFMAKKLYWNIFTVL